jgi:uncharacterized protein (TIGR02328 family)
MISYLPNAQLLGQWRECCAVAQKWADNTLNHAIVNQVMNYPVEDFIEYCFLVKQSMHERGWNTTEYAEVKLKDNFFRILELQGENDFVDMRATINRMMDRGEKNVWGHRIFEKWHTEDYYDICYRNLEEKYLCGCVPETEWARFCEGGLQYV